MYIYKVNLIERKTNNISKTIYSTDDYDIAIGLVNEWNRKNINDYDFSKINDYIDYTSEGYIMNVEIEEKPNNT
jgi:hypothetical protein